MKAFSKLRVSRSPVSDNIEIDGYYFGLKESLTPEEISEVLSHVKTNSPYAFTVGKSFGSGDLNLNNNNPNEKVKTMYLMTQFRTKTGTPTFSVVNEYGVSKLKCMSTLESINIEPKAVQPAVQKTEQSKPQDATEKVKEPPAEKAETSGKSDTSSPKKQSKKPDVQPKKDSKSTKKADKKTVLKN